MPKGPGGRREGSVWITAAITQAFHSVLSSLQLAPCLRVFGYRICGCHAVSVRIAQHCSLLCLSTRIDEHTGVKFDWVPSSARSRQAPTDPPVKVYEA